jgi:PncC family amidohydrolase
VTSSEEFLRLLRARGLTLAVAESETGGLLLERLTAVPGSSAVVLGGVVAYHDGLKVSMLGVSEEVLRLKGAVSAEVALGMATGMRRLAGADVGIATTGIAGPGGATDTKPIGLAYVAAVSSERTLVREFRWRGDRAANRASSADAALSLVVEILEK